MKGIFSSEERKKLDVENLNEALSLGTKILKMAYIFLIIAAIYAITMLLKEWGILIFILRMIKVLAPFFIGLVIAWLLEPIVTYLQGKGINRIIGTSIVYAVLIAIIYLIFNTMIPLLWEQINDFIQFLPSVVDDITRWFNNLFDGVKTTEFIDFDSIRLETISTIENIIVNVTTELPTRFIEILKNTFAAFGVFTLGLIIGFYLLFDFDNAGKVIFGMIPKNYRKDSKQLLVDMNESIFNFVKGTLIRSIIVFLLSSLMFSVVGLRAPILFGLICGITNIIPYIGPYLGAIPAVVVALTQNIAMGIIVLILLIIVQAIEGNFINPYVMKENIKLHPVQVLIGLLLFYYFFGILGLIIAAPAIMAIKIIIEFLQEKLKNRLKI